jgi:hypothetical protein
MRILEFGPQAARDVADFGSQGLRALGVVRNDGFAVDVLHVSAARAA